MPQMRAPGDTGGRNGETRGPTSATKVPNPFRTHASEAQPSGKTVYGSSGGGAASAWNDQYDSTNRPAPADGVRSAYRKGGREMCDGGRVSDFSVEARIIPRPPSPVPVRLTQLGTIAEDGGAGTSFQFTIELNTMLNSPWFCHR